MSNPVYLKISNFFFAFTLLFAMSAPAFAADPEELVFVFQKQKDPARIKSEADRVAGFLSKAIGMPVRAHVPTDYSAAVQAMVSKKADVAYVDSMAFLLARRDGDAKVLLAEQRVDPKGVTRTEYDSIFVVHKDSPLKSIGDLTTKAKELDVVFTSPTSTSGYIMAYRRLVEEGLLKPKQDPKEAFKSVSFGGSYTQALERVLAGDGDVCAVSYYALEGPSADKYLTAEKRKDLRVLARTPGVPTHVVAVRDGLSDQLQKKVHDALLKLSKEKPELLSDVYGTSRFTDVNEDTHVQSAVEAVDYTGLPIRGIVAKKL